MLFCFNVKKTKNFLLSKYGCSKIRADPEKNVEIILFDTILRFLFLNFMCVCVNQLILYAIKILLLLIGYFFGGENPIGYFNL